MVPPAPGEAQIESPPTQSQGPVSLFEEGRFDTTGGAPWLRYQPTAYGTAAIARFGWWGISSQGSQVKTGEYQSLNPSQFWDIDGLSSNGFSTLDLTLSGLTNDANAVRGYYFRPGFTAEVDYERYYRRLDHLPLDNFGMPATTSTLPTVADDLNAGEDYAIRVQEFEAGFKGHITENIAWKLNLWGMRKQGERQANSHAHCQDVNPGPASNLKCHVVSQRQRIDWLTMEIEPVVEGRFGTLTLEYSRPMRGFSQDDQIVQRTYNHFGVYQQPGGEFANVPLDYAFVPDNYTEIDQLKIGWDVTPYSKFYGLLYNGDTRNQQRKTDRSFYGFDARLTNRSLDSLTWTVYGKRKIETNEAPPYFLSDQGEPIVTPASIQGPIPPGIPVTDADLLDGIRFSDIRHPVNYGRTQVGARGRWSPFSGGWLSRLAFTGGYEYAKISRSYVTWVIGDSDNPYRRSIEDTGARIFTQPDTESHTFQFGTETRWSPSLDTYVRYTTSYINDPLYGLRLSDETYADTGEFGSVANTNLPQHEDLIQFGGNWYPADNFLLSGWIGLEWRTNYSALADFDEADYPIVFSVWYAPTPRWNLTGGMAFYSNWINQDITVGFREEGTTRGFSAFTEPWDYRGFTQLYSVGTSYAWTDSFILRGDVEWLRGTDTFLIPPEQGIDFGLVPSFSSLIVETTKISAGFDYLLSQRTSTYFRYQYFDYDDATRLFDSGTAHMFLGGVSATF